MSYGEILLAVASVFVCARKGSSASFSLKWDKKLSRYIITNFSSNTEGNQTISKSNLYNLPELCDWFEGLRTTRLADMSGPQRNMENLHLAESTEYQLV